MVAIAAGIFAIVTSLLGLIKPDAHLRPDAPVWKTLLSHRLSNAALALGIFSLATSVVVHWRWGHGPDTAAPMDLSRLLYEHEAFSIVWALLLLALILALYRTTPFR
jgi:hypothetical protein